MVTHFSLGKQLSTQEAAGQLGVSVQHLRVLARSEQIKGKKEGRDWFYDPTSIENFRKERSNLSKPATRSQRGPFVTFGSPVWEHTHEQADFGLLHGDAASILRQLPEESIDTCVTSPPYWQARDYGSDLQIGLEDSIDDYISKIVAVFEGVRRVLRPSGSTWLNLGDSYFSGSKSSFHDWQRNKQLTLLPHRVAIALQDAGWYVRNTVVWNKPNAMPASVKDRLSNNWEPVFLLTKNDSYYFDLDKIRVPHKTSDLNERRRAEGVLQNGKAQGMQPLRKWLNSPRHRATIDGLKEIRRRPNAPSATELAKYLKYHLEKNEKSVKWVASQLGQPFERVRHYFRTDKIGARLPPEETWETIKKLLDLDGAFDESMSIEVGDNVFRNHPNGRNPGDVFTAAVGSNDFSHFAVMPDKLASWCLSATLPKNGICIDPFAGICTTGRAAIGMGGKFLGIDINKNYLSLGNDILLDQLANAQ